jgi:hypothetical protein
MTNLYCGFCAIIHHAVLSFYLRRRNITACGPLNHPSIAFLGVYWFFWTISSQQCW